VDKTVLYLVGTTLEFSGGLNGKGFVFNNLTRNVLVVVARVFVVTALIEYRFQKANMPPISALQLNSAKV
jgi:type III secretory pathway component EscU